MTAERELDDSGQSNGFAGHGQHHNCTAGGPAEMSDAPPIEVILLDIEGTTCPIAFVSEVLFPYAREHLADHIRAHAAEPEVRRQLQHLIDWDREHAGTLPVAAERSSQQQSSTVPDTERAIGIALAMIDADLKVTALKELQGRIWNRGYESGDLKVSLFPEVSHCLRQWRQKKRTLAVYSSGSRRAQQLLYSHTTEGDLSSLFSHWFDTTSGRKTDAASYRTIASQLGCQPSTVLFVSDARAECDAASTAGCRTAYCHRDGNREDTPGPHRRIERLDQLLLMP
ncbi:acireductone synthase [Synechococcus sp. RSCCF101]|uniref:acireductone synthase n=1 Tax=Synechococcus sp. RSCCF101 TaxID=2511069 RepID=UPI001249440A|nr:acireductone synthase [Synechococcus sp. RSCCF101]QEY32102.1 acireductone synthase [Synechococcus sp. RSCCF101]